MTPYHEYFLPIFLLGLLIAGVASLVAGSMSGCVWPGVLLIVGVLAFWVSLFIGSDLGYRAWQSMPDPPDEAFSDASVLGALVMGWVPGGLFCAFVFSLARGVRWFLHWANPDEFQWDTKPAAKLDAELVGTSDSKPIETGNPYQGPDAR